MQITITISDEDAALLLRLVPIENSVSMPEDRVTDAATFVQKLATQAVLQKLENVRGKRATALAKAIEAADAKTLDAVESALSGRR